MKYKLSFAIALMRVCSKFLTKLLQLYLLQQESSHCTSTQGACWVVHIPGFDRSITSANCHHDKSSFPLQRHFFGFRWFRCQSQPDIGNNLRIEFLLSLRRSYPGDTPCPCRMVIFGILTGPSVNIIEVVTQHFNQATVIGHTGFFAMDLRYCTIINNPSLGGLSCPPHKKTHSLLHRPESL